MSRIWPLIYLLDTNAASAAADPDGPAYAFALNKQSEDQLAVSAITVGEMEFGSSRIRERARRQLIAEQEAHFLTFIDTVFSVTIEVAHQYAQLRLQLERNGTQIPVNDLWIAATALVHECVLVSFDRHFDRVPNLTRIEL